MQFTSLVAIAIASAAASPLAARYSNDTTVVGSSSWSSVPATVSWSSSVKPSLVSLTTSSSSKFTQRANVTIPLGPGPEQPVPSTTQQPTASIHLGPGPEKPVPTVTPVGPYVSGNGTSQTSVGKPNHKTITVYQPEIIVTVINQVTIIATVYNVPVTTAVGPVVYTLTPQPQITSTRTAGTQTVVVIQAVTQTPIPTITSTVTVGTAVSTVLVVPSAGPVSIHGGPAPSQTVAGTYTYTALNNVCVCPLPTTVTQYVTIQTSSKPSTTATAQTTSSIVAPANCAAPATAAYPTLFPGFIIPVQAANPAKSYGTKYIANINGSQEVVFQFNVAKTGKCSLNLALPPKAQLTTSSWSVTGDGLFSVAKLPTSVVESVSYNQLPGGLSFRDFTLVQGGTAVIGDAFDCVAGTTATFLVKTKNGSSVQFFEDYNCPYVGLSLVEA